MCLASRRRGQSKQCSAERGGNDRRHCRAGRCLHPLYSISTQSIQPTLAQIRSGCRSSWYYLQWALVPTVRVVMESQAFGHPPASINLVGPSEGSWSFGQLLPLLLLVLPFMSLVEIMRGEMRLAPIKMSDESIPLYASGGDMEFQPHPLAASATNLFKR